MTFGAVDDWVERLTVGDDGVCLRVDDVSVFVDGVAVSVSIDAQENDSLRRDTNFGASLRHHHLARLVTHR